MNSEVLPLASSEYDIAYQRNKARSIIFLVGLGILLLIAFLLSLQAGSYHTPISELIKGVFGEATDQKINLVIQNNR